MITLTTPTGTVGRKVLRALLHQNASVRVIARDPARLPDEVRAGIEVVTGSMADPATLKRAFAGAEALFWCQPDPVAASDYVDAYAALAHLATEAVRTTALPRVVAITAAGEPPTRPAGTISGLAAIESELTRSGAAVRFLRCGSFFDNLLWQWETIVSAGRFTLPMSGAVPNPHVATGDIAHLAAGLLMDSTWSGVSAVQALGPRDLTYDEIAAALTPAIGRPVAFSRCEPEDYRTVVRANGFSASAAQGHLDMFAYLGSDFRSPAESRANTPTTIEAWLQRAM